jgi:hypothetical protein
MVLEDSSSPQVTHEAEQYAKVSTDPQTVVAEAVPEIIGDADERDLSGPRRAEEDTSDHETDVPSPARASLD